MTETLTKTHLLAIICCLSGALLPAGHSLGVVNTPEKVIRVWIDEGLTARGISLSQFSEVTLWALVVSIFVAGAMAGNIAAPKIADRIGRKETLFIIMVLNIICSCSFFLCFRLFYVELLLFGRLVSGLATGLATCVASLYLSEVCPSSFRGVVSAVVPLGFSSGMLIAFIVGMPQFLGVASLWPLLMGLPIFYTFVGLILLKWCPASPDFIFIQMARKNRKENYVTRVVEGETVTLTSGTEQEEYWTLKRILLSPIYRRPLIFVFLLNIGQQLSGVNAIFYYSMLMFRSAGMDEKMSNLATLCMFTANVFMAALALLLLRKYKRKTLLLVSLSGVLVCLAVVLLALSVLASHTTSTNDQVANEVIIKVNDTLIKKPSGDHMIIVDDTANFQYLMDVETTSTIPKPDIDFIAQIPCVVAMLAMIAYVFLYGIGLGPVPYCYAAETFPTGPRSIGVAVGGVANWCGNLLVGITFPILQKAMGHYSFIIFAISVFIVLVAVLWKLPPENTNGSGTQHLLSSEQKSDTKEEETSDTSVNRIAISSESGSDNEQVVEI